MTDAKTNDAIMPPSDGGVIPKRRYRRQTTAVTKRPTTVWIESLQQWNKTQNNGTYLIPKRGTPEYESVISIKNNRMGSLPVKEEKVRVKRQKKAVLPENAVKTPRKRKMKTMATEPVPEIITGC